MYTLVCTLVVHSDYYYLLVPPSGYYHKLPIGRGHTSLIFCHCVVLFRHLVVKTCQNVVISQHQ